MVFFVHIAQRHQLTKPRHIAQKTNTRSTRFCAYCTTITEQMFWHIAQFQLTITDFFVHIYQNTCSIQIAQQNRWIFVHFSLLTFGQCCAIIYSQNIGMGKRTDVPFLVTKRGLCNLHKNNLQILCILPIALFLILCYYIYIVRNEH